MAKGSGKGFVNPAKEARRRARALAKGGSDGQGGVTTLTPIVQMGAVAQEPAPEHTPLHVAVAPPPNQGVAPQSSEQVQVSWEGSETPIEARNKQLDLPKNQRGWVKLTLGPVQPMKQVVPH